MKIREIRQEEARELLELLNRLDSETDFMLLEPGERPEGVQAIEKKIEAIKKAKNKNLFVAEEKGQLVGFLEAVGGDFKKNHYTLYIVIGVLNAFSGRGIGKNLFTQMEKWAREKGMHRLELTVMTNNKNAVKLYEKMGFSIEGLRKQCLRVGDSWGDEFYMGKIL